MFVQLVIAAITTLPWPTLVSVAGSSVTSVVAGELVDARAPALGHEATDLGGLRVGLEMVAEGADERVPDVGQRHPVLRSLRPGHRRHDRRQVEVEDLAERRLRVAVAPEQPLLLRVALDEVDAVAATR